MSLPNSPPLNLELRAPRHEAQIAWAAVILAAAVPTLFFPSIPGVMVGFFAGGVLYLGFANAQWLAPARSIARLSWLADGRWLAQDAAGTVWECELRSSSRAFAKAAWLCLEPSDASRKPFYLLLTSGGLRHPGELRRLIVRLRLDGMRSQTSPEMAET